MVDGLRSAVGLHGTRQHVLRHEYGDARGWRERAGDDLGDAVRTEPWRAELRDYRPVRHATWHDGHPAEFHRHELEPVNRTGHAVARADHSASTADAARDVGQHVEFDGDPAERAG